MNPDPASLSNLRDIVTPAPPPWWPPAPGWWIVLAASGLIGVALLVQLVRRWHKNAYRRAALRELRGAQSVASIAEVLKRAALATTPRAQVASLTGSRWMDWLTATGGQTVPISVRSALTNDIFAEDRPAVSAEVALFAAQWIRCHRVIAHVPDER